MVLDELQCNKEVINKFYICTQDMDGKGPELIGVLEKLPSNELQFRYMLDKCLNFPNNWVKISGMNCIRNVYDTAAVRNNLLNWVLPRKGTLSDKMFRKGIGTEEDEDDWTLLNSYWNYWESIKPDKYPAHDSHRRYYFYKEIPKLVRRYDL